MSTAVRGRGPTSALVLVVLLAASVGCSRAVLDRADGEVGSPSTPERGGVFTIQICSPDSLLPSNTTGRCGSQILRSLYRGLINYRPEDGTPTLEDAVARSITTEDDRTFTVSLKDGWTFHNGDPVDSRAFVDSWNFAAHARNGQRNAALFSQIEGFEDVNPPVPAGASEAPAPRADTLAGLEVIDALTFEVTLSEPFPQWPLTVGRTAFYPVPTRAFDDPERFERSPVGNGPFEMRGNWHGGQVIRLERYDDYAGAGSAHADAVKYRIVDDPATAYDHLVTGTVDIATSLPRPALASIREELGERFIERPSPSVEAIGIPMYDPQLGEPAGESGRMRRRALSLAVDRDAIDRDVFGGGMLAARGFISPAVRGFREQACAEATAHDPVGARELWARAGDLEGPLVVWFDEGMPDVGWLEAVADQWRETLQVEEIRFEQHPRGAFLRTGLEQGYTGPFRLHWELTYPSPLNYLEPLYSSGATPPSGSNLTFYANPDLDRLVDHGSQKTDPEEAIPYYHRAEDILCADLPAIPIRWGAVHGAHGERVTNVVVDLFGHVRAADVAVTGRR